MRQREGEREGGGETERGRDRERERGDETERGRDRVVRILVKRAGSSARRRKRLFVFFDRCL